MIETLPTRHKTINLQINKSIYLLNSYMGGEEVPESWKGAINTTYRIGGPLQNSGW